MNYELAKKLKDKGFPQNHDWIEGKYTIHCNKCSSNVTLSDYESCRPTLSELIEACGDGFIYLKRIKDGYYETATPKDQVSTVFTCLTPETAVANLWLELNKK